MNIKQWGQRSTSLLTTSWIDQIIEVCLKFCVYNPILWAELLDILDNWQAHRWQKTLKTPDRFIINWLRRDRLSIKSTILLYFEMLHLNYGRHFIDLRMQRFQETLLSLDIQLCYSGSAETSLHKILNNSICELKTATQKLLHILVLLKRYLYLN